ncbi:hypothetical protein Rin_00021410 [Candidatus Regiella insecticola 5.15]|uniref:Uncharacterized protein n=1 Tax=Candidatus Regiella insecticola 5.15 TaxID=1005043 RepID=G2H244_9ENTR|nr:hypothetical protein Rin_00021410 [Candidatus Regiella insecticola 5.15]
MEESIDEYDHLTLGKSENSIYSKELQDIT